MCVYHRLIQHCEGVGCTATQPSGYSQTTPCTEVMEKNLTVGECETGINLSPVTHSAGYFLCIKCFDKRLEEMGVAHLVARKKL